MRGEGRFFFECRALDAASVRAGARISQYRIIHLRKGSLFRDVGEGAHRLSGEQVLFFPAGSRDRVETKDALGFLFLFDEAFLTRVISLLDLAAIRRFRLDGRGEPESSVISLAGEKSSGIREALQSLERESLAGGDVSLPMIAARFVELITLSERLLVQAPPPGENASAWQIRDLKEYLATHYSETVSLDQLAGKYGMSASHLSRIFSQTCGLTLFEYLNRLRIEKACHLLKHSELPVIDISATVGYNNLSFFNRYFRRITGMTPREYRFRT